MRFISLIFIFLIVSRSKNNCKEINSNFDSYKEAIEIVQNSSFAIEEKVNTDSSWIDSNEYYSCDEVFGYLIVNTKNGKSYIHKNVPIEVWDNFKNANSSGKYYNANIKGRYNINM